MPLKTPYSFEDKDVPNDPDSVRRRRRLKYVGYTLWLLALLGVVGLALLVGTGMGDAVGLGAVTIDSWHFVFSMGDSSVTFGFVVNGDSLFEFTLGV
jgi:hypothetical protein